MALQALFFDHSCAFRFFFCQKRKLNPKFKSNNNIILEVSRRDVNGMSVSLCALRLELGGDSAIPKDFSYLGNNYFHNRLQWGFAKRNTKTCVF